MTDQEHIDKLRKGVQSWNQWRKEKPTVTPNLEKVDLWAFTKLNGVNFRRANLTAAHLDEHYLNDVDLSDANLREAILNKSSFNHVNFSNADLYRAHLVSSHFLNSNLSDANLSEAYAMNSNFQYSDFTKANLMWARFWESKFSSVNFTKAKLSNADFRGADLRGAQIINADLSGSILSYADLTGANLTGSDLRWASLIGTKLNGTKLNGCKVYGISAWDIHVDDMTSQQNLIITYEDQDTVTVDNLEVAQFIHMLLENKKIQKVIDTVTSKVVLILGRFSKERIKVLKALRDELRTRNYIPILFDFDKPDSRDITETIVTLASMARFVIADISTAKSIPQELSHIIPNLPSVPIQPLIMESDQEYSMFEHWRPYPWVLPEFHYVDDDHLLTSLKDKVIAPAEQKRLEQTHNIRVTH